MHPLPRLHRRTVLRGLAAAPIALLWRGFTTHAEAAPAGAGMWQIGPSPAGPRTADRYGIAALSPHDIWTVGSMRGTDGVVYAYAEHWDGATWQEAAIPRPIGLRPPRPVTAQGASYRGDVLQLRAVAGTAADDVWAVGNFQQGDTNRVLILHWNGTRWETVAVPPSLETVQASLRAVVALARDDAWAVGEYQGEGERQTAPLTLHWDGAQWELVPAPPLQSADGDPPGIEGALRAVSATTPDDVWAVGSESGDTHASSPLILHWDGARWDRIPISGPVGAGVGLSAVAARARDDAWTVGTPAGGKQPLVLHWNGAIWQTVTVPDVPGERARLVAVAALALNDVWAVGTSNTFERAEDVFYDVARTIVYHWDGAAWMLTLPIVPGSGSIFGSGGPTALAVASPTDLWALGEFGDARYLRYTTLLS